MASVTPPTDPTAATEALLARRLEVVEAMFAGRARYEDVLAFHDDDAVWLSAAGARQGHAATLELHAERMARIPPQAMRGFRPIRLAACGEYGFMMFKTDEVPLGTDTYRVVDGKVVLHSNALYLPEHLRRAGS